MRGSQDVATDRQSGDELDREVRGEIVNIFVQRASSTSKNSSTRRRSVSLSMTVLRGEPWKAVASLRALYFFASTDPDGGKVALGFGTGDTVSVPDRRP